MMKYKAGGLPGDYFVQRSKVKIFNTWFSFWRENFH